MATTNIQKWQESSKNGVQLVHITHTHTHVHTTAYDDSFDAPTYSSDYLSPSRLVR